MPMVTLVIEHDLTTLDALLFRHARREIAGLVEATLALNPGLAESGPYLPVGTRVRVDMPAPTPQERSARPVVSLYD